MIRRKFWAGLTGLVLVSAGLELEAQQVLDQKVVDLRYILDEIAIRDVVWSHIRSATPESQYLKEIQESLRFRDDVRIKRLVQEYIGENYLKEIERNARERVKRGSDVGEEKAVEYFSLPHRLCLDLALKYRGKQIPEQDYLDLSKKIINIQHWISRYARHSHVNHLDPRVYQATQEWGDIRTREFQKLIDAGQKVDMTDLSTRELRLNYVNRLYRAAFSAEEYWKHLQDEERADNQIESALSATITAGPFIAIRIKNEISGLHNQAREVRGFFYQRIYSQSN